MIKRFAVITHYGWNEVVSKFFDTLTDAQKYVADNSDEQHRERWIVELHKVIPQIYSQD